MFEQYIKHLINHNRCMLDLLAAANDRDWVRCCKAERRLHEYIQQNITPAVNHPDYIKNRDYLKNCIATKNESALKGYLSSLLELYTKHMKEQLNPMQGK